MLERYNAGDIHVMSNTISFNHCYQCLCKKTRDRDAAVIPAAILLEWKPVVCCIQPNTQSYNSLILAWTNSRDLQADIKAEGQDVYLLSFQTATWLINKLRPQGLFRQKVLGLSICELVLEPMHEWRNCEHAYASVVLTGNSGCRRWKVVMSRSNWLSHITIFSLIFLSLGSTCLGRHEEKSWLFCCYWVLFVKCICKDSFFSKDKKIKKIVSLWRPVCVCAFCSTNQRDDTDLLIILLLNVNILNIFLEPRKHRVDLRNKYAIYKIQIYLLHSYSWFTRYRFTNYTLKC